MVPDTFPALFYGYSVVWLLMLVYVLLMARRLSKVEQKLSSQEGDTVERGGE